jgi:hypothetical protein
MRTLLLGVLLCAMAVLSATGPASAAPSLFGYTGLVKTPTADTLSLGQFNAAAFSVHQGDTATVLAGNLSFFPGLEAGLAFIDVDHGGSNTILNAKYRFRSEGTVMPEVAVGWADITNELDSTPYIVLSKGLSPVGRDVFNPRVNVGVGSGLLDGIFAGVSADVGRSLALMVEYDTSDINIGARYALTPEVLVHAAGLAGLTDYAFGVSYTKGL